MRLLPLLLALGLALPCAAQPVALGGGSSARVLPAGSHYLLLHSGETIVGEVHAHPHPEAPTHVVANGRHYDLAYVRAFGVAEGEFAVLGGTGTRPLVLVRREAGRLSVYEPVRGGGLTYIRVGDGPLRLQTSAALRAAFADDPEAMRHLRREQAYGHLGLGAMAVGAGLVAAGAVVELTPMEGPNGIVLAGSGVLFATVVNAVVPGLQARARRDAIRTYNR